MGKTESIKLIGASELRVKLKQPLQMCYKSLGTNFIVDHGSELEKVANSLQGAFLYDHSVP